MSRSIPIVKRLRGITVGIAVAGVLLWLITPWLIRLVPLPTGLLESRTADVELVDRNGTPLRALHGTNGFQGRIASLQEVPDSLVRATLAAEDARFWQHQGVDWRASLRAAIGLLRNGRVISGGSTISQQVIKLAEPRPRMLRTKLIEAAQAMRLEQLWSKERILAEYLNRLDYGNRRFGIVAAADFYFGKPASDLSEAEAAFLAGLPQAPSRLNPHGHFARAKKRQEWILERERIQGTLALDAMNRAVEQPLQLQPPRGVFRAPHFVDLLLSQTPPSASNRGLIRTTVDLPLNDFVQRALSDQLGRLRKQNVRDGAVVIIENGTGNILALVGSDNYFATDDGQVNGAWAPRSAGSTFKPFTYLLALERGATPATIAADVPVEFPTPTGIFAPLNYDRRCYGPTRYRLALANSLNISAVRVLDSVGGPAVLQKRLQECGLTTLKKAPEFYGLGLTIGNAETRLVELANAYACLARLGEFRPIKLVSESSPKNGRQVFASDASYLIADILNDNFARALAFGANSSLHFDFPVACKTGTSSDFRDNWAMGFTPEFTVGVWMGNFDGSPMRDVSGVSGAAPVLHDVFAHLHDSFGTSWFATPTNIVERWVHPITGKLVSPDFSDAVLEKFLARNHPPAASSSDYDSLGRVRLPPEFRNWLADGRNWLAGRAVVESDENLTFGDTHVRIISPQPGTTYFLDPDLPDHGSRLRLQTSADRDVNWRSETMKIERNEGGTFAIMSAGRHELLARDERTGSECRTWISVKPL